MSLRTGILLCALVALTAPVDTSALGVGGRLRQRVDQAASQDKKPDQAQERPLKFDAIVVEINEASLRGLENGLDTEIRLLEAFAALLAPYKSLEEYRACVNQLGENPGFKETYMQILMHLANVRDGATMEEMQRATEKMNRDMAALVLKACGPDPDDWPEHKRREKIEEIARKAAAAAGPIRSFRPEPHGGPFAIDDGDDTAWDAHEWAATYTGAQQTQGLPYHAYLVMKERVQALCTYLDVSGHTPTPGYQLHFPASLIDPNGNPKIFWVFMPDEVKQIQAICPPIQLKLGKVQIILEMPPIRITGRTK